MIDHDEIEKRCARARALFGGKVFVDAADLSAAGIMSRSQFHKLVKLNQLRTQKMGRRRGMSVLDALDLIQGDAA
jgi:hypothetical protein